MRDIPNHQFNDVCSLKIKKPAKAYKKNKKYKYYIMYLFFFVFILYICIDKKVKYIPSKRN